MKSPVSVYTRTMDEKTKLFNWNAALDVYDPEDSAAVWIAWLVAQLVFLVVLLLFSGLHFGLVKPDLCNVTVNATNSLNSTSAASSPGPSCGFAGAVLALAILFCVISAVDVAMSSHYLIQTVSGSDGIETSQDQSTKRLEFPFCCFSKKQAWLTNVKFPYNTVRVGYCWILVHSILITVAANTYQWSWETDDLSVLANTGTFFSTCVAYLLLVFAIITWQISACCRKEKKGKEEKGKEEKGKEVKGKQEQNKELREGIDKEGKITKQFAVLLTLGLIGSNILCMVLTLVVFFYPKPGSSNRTVGLALVLVYVTTTTVFWWLMLTSSYKYSHQVFDSACKRKFLVTIGIFIVVLVVTLLPVSIKFSLCPQCDVSLWLLFFLIPLVSLIPFGVLSSVLLFNLVYVHCKEKLQVKPEVLQEE